MFKIKITDLDYKYKDKTVFSNINLELDSKYSYAVMGKSGIGKSTFFHSLQDPDNLKKKIHMIENHNSQIIQPNIFSLTVQNFFTSLSCDRFIYDLFLDNSMQMPSEEVLDAFDLPWSILNKKVKNCSGGQIQRIQLLRNLFSLNDKKIFLLDEALSAVDPSSRLKILLFLKQYLKDKLFIFINHDVEVLLHNIVDKVIFMTRKRAKVYDINYKIYYLIYKYNTSRNISFDTFMKILDSIKTHE